MELKTINDYSNIFGNEDFQLETFQKLIPREEAIKLCCYLSSKIYSNQDNKETQLELINIFLSSQPENIKRKILNSFYNANTKEINIFKQIYINEFLIYSLNHCEIFEYDKNNSEIDLIKLKAYLKIIEIYNNKYQIISNTSKEEYFETNIWPLVISQIKDNFEIYPFTPYLKTILFFHFIVKETNVKIQLRKYFNTLKQNPIDFLNYLIKIVTDAMNRNRSFVLKVDDIGDLFFSKFVFNQEEFEKSLDKNSYLMINPLFKFEEKGYFIYNYNYLANKIYTGFLFDFHKFILSEKNDINSINIQSISNYRSFIGEYFTEKYLFRTLIRIIFKEKFYKILFDNGKYRSFPDAIIFYKNNLIIFEIKDVSINHKIFINKNYLEIREMLNNKYGSKEKGTGQLVKFLSNFSEKKYSQFLEKNGINVDPKKVKIFPVIIYTESAFDCPGFMNYLNRTFEKELMEMFTEIQFQYVSNLSFIGIDFIIDHLDYISSYKTSFLKVLKEVNKETKKRKNKLNTRYKEGDLEKYNENFGSYYNDLFKPETEKDYINFLNKEIDLVTIFKEILVESTSPPSESRILA